MKIKLHTSPLKELIYDKVGVFIKETASFYMFEGFAVRKANVINIREVEE
jgi:hypothetical protein